MPFPVESPRVSDEQILNRSAWPTVKTWTVRALYDVFVLAVIGATVIVCLWAYHGQVAYSYLQQVIAQQQQAQQRSTPPK